MKDVVMPAVGVAMAEGTLIRWLRGPGEHVGKGEPIVEIETDKAAIELESPASGRLGPHLYEAGATVPAGAMLVQVLEEGDYSPASSSPRVVLQEAAQPAAPLVPVAISPPVAQESGRARHSLTPRARRLARERVDQPSIAAEGGRYRALIAERVQEAWRTIPHFAVSREVRADAILVVLEERRAVGIQMTLTDLMLRALALALRQASQHQQADLGLAVATEHGVVVPVIRGVLELRLEDLARERHQAVERARRGRLSPADLAVAPASTLSNLGSLGVDNFTGIIASGQSSLLTIGRIRPRVVVENGGSAVVRNTFIATLNADHRFLDGADAARLLTAFASAVEDKKQLGESG